MDLAGLRIVDLGGLRDGLGMEANHIKGSDALSRETGSPGDRPNSSRVPGAALTEEEIPSELIGDFGSVVFLIDMPNLTGRTKARFAARWVNWLERAEPPTLPLSIYILDTFNRLHQLTPPTRDLDRIRPIAEAIKKMRINNGFRRDRVFYDFPNLQFEEAELAFGTANSFLRTAATETDAMLTELN